MFTDRAEAGELLADAVERLGLRDPLVLALPRGGVPVALPVARRLAAPLDLALVRKIGLPDQPELAAGALMSGPEGDTVVFNDDVLAATGCRPADFAQAIERLKAENAARRLRYLGQRAPEPVAGRWLVVVDDGIATGATVRAALQGLRRQGPAGIVLAVPVAPAETLERLRPLVEQLVCLAVPRPFHAVGQHYLRFEQVSDAEVAQAMAAAGEHPGAG